MISNITISRNQILILATTLMLSAAWVLFRVWNVRPAILGDEWVYTMSSRHRPLWDQAPDSLGNHLFNFVYKSTLLCGDAFYQCGKALNLLFFIGFVLIIFLIAMRYLGFWWSLAVALSTTLSPLSVYVSMYLPEPLYMFFLGLTLTYILEAVKRDTWQSWAVSGSILALAALTKPHALISLVAIGLFILVYSLGKPNFLKNVFVRGLTTLGAFLIVRVGLGFLIAGPIGMNFLTSYGASDAVGEIVAGPAGEPGGLSPAETAFALFPAQFEIHVLTAVAALGAFLVPLLVNVIRLFGKKGASEVQIFGLLIFIWFGVMVVAIVLFTGWVTGTGDDHTTRVLLRYYDFLFPLLAVAGLAVTRDFVRDKPVLWVRLIGAGLLFVLATYAYTGIFGSLTIQIADAPTLAGLVVNTDVYNISAGLVVLTAVAVAFTPALSKYAVATAMAVGLVLTGFQAQGQYIQFRGQDSSADVAGKLLATSLSQIERDAVAVVSATRFDGRVASLWMDSDNQLVLVSPGSVINQELLAPEITRVLLLGDIEFDGVQDLEISGEGFRLIRVDQP